MVGRIWPTDSCLTPVTQTKSLRTELTEDIQVDGGISGLVLSWEVVQVQHGSTADASSYVLVLGGELVLRLS